jgi:peroxin-5
MSLLGAAECSTAVNPLSQFSKHINEDTSLQRDRLTEHGTNGLQESFRSQAYRSTQDEVNLTLQLVKAFLVN